MIKILTIGNSFADNATVYLEEIAAAGSVSGFIIGKANIGGCSLEKHWNLVEQCEVLTEVRPYNFFRTDVGYCNSTLKEALTSERWDFVTLQQLSSLSWRTETYYPYIENLYDFIRMHAPQSRLLIHQTWAYRSDAAEYGNYGFNQEEMFARLKQSYQDVAKKLGCRIIPSGQAFQKARSIFKYIPDRNYDFENARPFELPEQSKSLVKGYYWLTGNTGSGKAELHLDAKHGNSKGCYLANAVWFEILTGKSINDNVFWPDGITKEELAVLKSVARETVKEYGGYI